jgi:hypothetical protein
MSSSLQIVADHNFIVATRETGYRSLTTALCELVDNAAQANARRVQIVVREERARTGAKAGERQITIAVLDDGIGMNRHTLWRALQFGGTGRFGDRSGLGRFGMGLPNSSVSQSRRLEVYSWQRSAGTLFSYLDVDEVAGRRLRRIPPPIRRDPPDWIRESVGPTGTLVVWPRCDRLDFRKAITIADKLIARLGRIYRHLIWRGFEMRVNDRLVDPIDPLFCHPETGEGGGVMFGTPLTYEVSTPGVRTTSVLQVRFTELPVRRWHRLSTDQKRNMSIVGGAGVSVVRAGREIDYGWHLLGAKRRENYDDWWRCEVIFTPDLDEYFGVTHSKQGVSPIPALKAIVTPDLERIARELNRRVRLGFEKVKGKRESRAAVIATRRDHLLPPARSFHQQMGGRHWGLGYRIRSQALPQGTFYHVTENRGILTLILNKNHPFFTQLYCVGAGTNPSIVQALEKLLVAVARADLEAASKQERRWVEQHREAWSDALATFLDGAV